MPVASSTRLALNFTAAELGADKPDATPVIVENLRTVAGWLQVVRSILGVPIRVTRGFSTSTENVEVSGSPTSDHPNGLAADWIAIGLTPYQVYQKLTDAQRERRLPAFDQLILYAVDDHLHVGLGRRMRGELLLRTSEGTYVQLLGSYVSQIRGYL